MGHRAVCGNEDDLAPVGDLADGGADSGGGRAATEHVPLQNRRMGDCRGSTLAPFRQALIGSGITAFLTGAVLAIGISAGTPFLAMMVPAVIVGMLGGTLVSSLILARIQGDLQQPLLQYIDRLSQFRVRARSESFDCLKFDHPGPVGKLSVEVQRLVLEVYEGYSESIHLRRTMETTIKNETRKATARMNHIAYLDPLTGLSNRRAFDESIAEISASAQQPGRDVICLTIDIDYFKNVNDSIGHDRGDLILRFLADSMRAVVRETDSAFRFGGDEFVILLTDLTPAEAAEVAERLQTQFAQLTWPAHLTQICRKPTLSIGGASFKQSGCARIEELLKYSDEAMYGAKRAGKGCENIIGAGARQVA